MNRFIGILQFLTRVTLVKDVPYDEDFHKGVIYFPVVGLVLGIILAVVYYLFQGVVGHKITIILTVAISIILTGGLHLDGLADTFDGFYSSRSRERIMGIMKDSRLGTNGAVVILFDVLIKIACLQSLTFPKIYAALLITPVFGRLALVYGCYSINYARREGLGNIFIDRVGSREVWFSTVLAFVFSLLYIKSMFLVPITRGIAWLYKKHSKKIIGGMTGDTLGALCELTEIICVLFFVIV